MARKFDENRFPRTRNNITQASLGWAYGFSGINTKMAIVSAAGLTGETSTVVRDSSE